MWDPETEYYECSYCSYGISGSPFSPTMSAQMDEHESECQGTLRLVEEA